MATLNHVYLSGYVTRDADMRYRFSEIKLQKAPCPWAVNPGSLARNLCNYLSENLYLNTGAQLCLFSIGVPRSWQQEGEWKKETSFVDVKCWGDLAERVGEQLHKGAEVAIQGRLEQERWQTTEGNARSRIVIVADRIEVISQPRASRQAESNDDLPF
jgi:single-stranded DNA-binding protein